MPEQAIQPDIDLQLCQMICQFRKKLDNAVSQANQKHGKKYTFDE